MNNALIEKVWKRVASYFLSVSHDRHHIEVVLDYAEQLQEIYGGDEDIIAAAALLHDLGRGNDETAHGEESREASVEMAREVLSDLPLSEEKKEGIFTAIREHDQPGLSPTTIEGQILKDADFLAGFGAWGILRIAMWSGESGREVEEVKDKLSEGMLRRVRNVEFSTTRHIAYRKMPIVWLFLAQLEERANLTSVDQPGTYIWLEGVSGSGKDTQADLLEEYIEEHSDRGVTRVGEPAAFYKCCRDALEEEYEEIPNAARKWLFTADRQHLIDSTVKPALSDGQYVISVRSFLSTMVYQGASTLETREIEFDHTFVPKPDKVFLFDIDPDTAMERVEDRGEEKGTYESVYDIERHNAQFINIVRRKFGETATVIDASQTRERIHQQIVHALNIT